MKRLLLSSVAVLAVATSPALSADLMAVEEAPLAAPIAPAGPSWTGFYVGIHGGGVFGQSGLGDGCGDLDASLFDPVTPLRPAGPDTAPYDYSDAEIDAIECTSEEDEGDDISWLAGAHIGADRQFGNFVVGVLLDGNLIDSESSSSFSFDADSGVVGSEVYPGLELQGAISIGDADPGGVFDQEGNEVGTPLQSYSQTQSLEWYGTGRVRAGFAPGGGRFLIYGTGGLAFGEVEQSSTQTAVYTPDEADRVFDTPAGTVAQSDDDEYFPAFEAPFLPEGCADGPAFDPDGGGPAGLQTSVNCTTSSSEDDFRFGFALGGGVEVLLSQNFSIGAEALYVNLGGGDSFAGFGDEDLDFVTVSLKGTLRFGGGR